MDHGFEHIAHGHSTAFHLFSRDVCFDTGVASIQHGAIFVREKGEGGSGIGFLGHGGKNGIVPDEVGSVVDPKVGQIFGRLRCVLETAE